MNDRLKRMQEESKERNKIRFEDERINSDFVSRVNSPIKRNHYPKKHIKLSYDPTKLSEFIRKKMAS
jgi:hypothetical protein